MPEQTIKEEEVRDNASAGAENAAEDAARSETGTVPAAGAGTAEESQPAAADETVGRAEYEQLRAERDQLVDRLARLQAEFENARKRAERERADYRDYAAASVVEQFLPVLDNFDLALKSAGSTEQLRSGVELIVKQMEDVLRQMQVTPIPTVGEQFDPRHHEAIGTVEREDLPDHHVAEEIRRGYKIRDKLLRPSMVRIVSNPKQTVE
ncbi:MAG TPA: nucleotide exchange factor GrpE [Terracidiphilus sp.]|jgi:molecular chaperone GrpE|nr:nucleotide exchange factor GrpE [Terracidiphilus sp.]